MYVRMYLWYVPSLVFVLEYTCICVPVYTYVCGCMCGCGCTHRELTVFELSNPTNGMFAMMRSFCSCSKLLNGVNSPGLTPCGVVCGECS